VQRDDLRSFLTEFTADRLALLQRHEASARVVSNYDFNNTYQYVIAREETHVAWLQTAMMELGDNLPPAAPIAAVPDVTAGRNDAVAVFSGILSEEARLIGAFVDKWRERVNGLTHARHRTMLNVVLGESLEHKRLFEQAAGGSEDVIGRRTGGVARVGLVLPTRWQE
jgi:hypothetical protein